jgi:hypothetical protein
MIPAHGGCVLRGSLQHLASTARGIDTAVAGLTSPVPLFTFRTPPISMSVGCDPSIRNKPLLAR